MKFMGPIGSVVQGLGSIQQGRAAYASGKYTRKIMRENEKNTRGDGLEARDRIRTESRLALGRQITAQGGSGFQLGTGSALDALHESAIEREIDLATVRRQSEMKARGFHQQGDLAYFQGKQARTAGMISGAASFLEAGSQFADIMGQAASGGAG